MANPAEPLIHEQHLHSLTVLQIHTDKPVGRPLPALHQFIPPHLFLHNTALCKPSVFQLHLIIIVDIIQPHHLVSPFQQTLHDIRPDKPGCAGDQYFHKIYFSNIIEEYQIISPIYSIFQPIHVPQEYYPL